MFNENRSPTCTVLQCLLSVAKKVSVDVLENFFLIHVRVTVQKLPPAYHTLMAQRMKQVKLETNYLLMYESWYIVFWKSFVQTPNASFSEKL